MAESETGPVTNVPPPPQDAIASAGEPIDEQVAPPPPVAAQEDEAAPVAAADGDAPAAGPEVGQHDSPDGAEPARPPATDAPAADGGSAAPATAADTGAPVAAAAEAGAAEAGAAVKVEGDGAVAKEEPVAAEGQEDVKPEQSGEAQTETAAVEPPSDEVLVARLRELLAKVDLATTTEKQLRRQLEGEYGVDLSGRKGLLRAQINRYLEEADAEEAAQVGDNGAEAEEEEEEAPAAKGRKRKAADGSSLGSFLSPEMQEFLGEERLPRTQVVKRLWAYIKEHQLQDPKDKRTIIFDDKLKTLFTGTRCNMFKLQKQLSKHCKTSDVVGGSDDDASEEEGGSEEEEAEEAEEQRPAPKKARKAAATAPKASGSRKRGSSAGDEGKEKKPNGFTKECTLSADLAAWIGKPTASRPEITKYFWAYCKEKGLQDPTDKSFILADDALQGLTGEVRFKGFGFSKLIKDHITGYA